MSIKPSTHPQSLIITVWEAGDLIGLAPGTTRKYLAENRFPLEIRKLGRNRVCLRADAETFANNFFGREATSETGKSRSVAAAGVKRTGGRPRKVAPEPSV